MADIELVIKLDEEYIKQIDKLRFLIGGIEDRSLQINVINAIKNGTTLPKGHGRLIDEGLLQEKLALIPMEERTFRRTVEELENAPTVEAIPKAEYENRLKADLVAMLTDIQLEIDESIESVRHFPQSELTNGLEYAKEIIQQKINALKGE